ncbi:MAG: response regulator [Anaerolineaceae bacterium]|nr:response regulator [Anaerolineaceae bacterium]
MGQKRVLIVDDEEAILTVLKNSLKKLGAGCEVVTLSDSRAALAQLESGHFDLVVTDYNMPEVNGIELLHSIRALQAEARVILMTAYGSAALEAEAQRLHVYRYLTKPLEIDLFRRTVRSALAESGGPGVPVLSDEGYRQVHQMLIQLQSNVGARCVFLTSAEGRFIAQAGNIDQLPLEQISSLIAGGIASLLEAGRVMDGNGDTINLAYRESHSENLYAMNVGRDVLLVVITGNGPFHSRLGSVWHYARHTAARLQEKLAHVDTLPLEQLFNGEMDQELDAALEKLLADPQPYQAGSPAGGEPPAGPDFEQAAGQYPLPSDQPGLLSFDEAVDAGLLPPSASDANILF